VGLVLINLANSYLHQGEVEEAEPLVERAHQVFLETVGPDHPYFAMSLGQMAEVLSYHGEVEAAVEAYRRAVGILTETLGEDHPETLGMIQRMDQLVEGSG
jgi:Tfp pilus assembly protein PilF